MQRSKDAIIAKSGKVFPAHVALENFFNRYVKEDLRAEVAAWTTVKLWIFESQSNPNERAYFVANGLFSSNWMEKIRGSFDEPKKWRCVEEVDTRVPVKEMTIAGKELSQARLTYEFVKQKLEEWDSRYGRALYNAFP